jgi:hypothetical protein
MYYLIFNLPEVRRTLEDLGFTLDVRDIGFERPWTALRLVIARRL